MCLALQIPPSRDLGDPVGYVRDRTRVAGVKGQPKPFFPAPQPKAISLSKAAVMTPPRSYEGTCQGLGPAQLWQVFPGMGTRGADPDQ